MWWREGGRRTDRQTQTELKENKGKALNNHLGQMFPVLRQILARMKKLLELRRKIKTQQKNGQSVWTDSSQKKETRQLLGTENDAQLYPEKCKWKPHGDNTSYLTRRAKVPILTMQPCWGHGGNLCSHSAGGSAQKYHLHGGSCGHCCWGYKGTETLI